MRKELLHGKHSMRRKDQSETTVAQVPGTVYGALLDAGKMKDPYFKDNELEALELMKYEYEYTLKFTPSSEFLKESSQELVFDGLDTLAEVRLNGQYLGKADNMHRQWRYPIQDIVKSGENTLTVLFHSPTEFIQKAYEECQARGSEDAMLGFPHIRKAHYMFGWDWGPHLPDMGIWKDCYLEGNSMAKIDSVYLRQRHENGKVTLRAEVEETLFAPVKPTYAFTLTSPKGDETTFTEIEHLIEEPELWWPNGLGAQPLYQVLVVQSVDGVETDRYSARIGLRTMGMNTEKDEYGNKFAHCVNGVEVFAMGADYIPEDNLLGRGNYETTRKLLESCVAANFNSVRVWGGGYYPHDWFFDICDELGLLVWEDLMFACAVYELTEEFEANIVQEIRENVKRIRNHASLGLWCGNNEMEMFVAEGHWVDRPSQVADYTKMYEYVFPKLMKELDPDTFFWPASPSSGGAFDEPNSPDRGDVHNWEVWHGNKPFSEYRKHFFRYLSEFGFQAFPSIKTIETFTDDDKDKNPFSYIMERHQRNGAANGKIMGYLQQTYLYPHDFETFIYASQLLQAEAIKYGVEHFRRNRERCMGAVYWQLNDCWPVISWASVDYCGRWKALHYFAKRFFAPLMISCEEEGMLTQNMFVVDAAFHILPSTRLNVTNETHDKKEVLVRYSLRKNTGEILEEKEKNVTVHPFSATWLDTEEFHDIDIYGTYFYYELLENDRPVSQGSVIFSVPKYFRYLDPNLSATVEGDSITITATAYAKSVEILNENEDMILSDNYFDMNPGFVTVKIVSGTPEGIKLRSVYDIK